MNILFLNDIYGLGGGEIWASRMADALKKRGHNCAVGAPTQAPLHDYIGDDSMHFTYSRVDALSFVPRLGTFVKEHDIDVIVCTPSGNGLDTWALNEFCLSSSRIPAIVLKTGGPPHPNSAAHHYGYGLHPAFRRLLVVCKHNRRMFFRRFPELSSRFVHVQYTGIDLDYFREDRSDVDAAQVRDKLGIAHDVPLVVNVSRVAFLKGQAFLVQAAKVFLTEFPDAHLLIVGDGPPEELNLLKAVAYGCGLGDRIHFWGFQSDVRSILAAATVFVHPSLFEGIPNALLEAMSMRRACVATDVCGVPELVGNNIDALFVPPNDIDALASAISRLLSDSELRNSLARNAYRRAQAFSIHDRAREFETHLIQVTASAAWLSWRARRPGSVSPRRKGLARVKSVIITQSEGMGDQIQAYPFLHLSRNVFRKQHITLLVPDERRRLFEHFGFDEIVSIQKNEDVKRYFEDRSFDIAFDLNLRPNLNPTKDLNVRRLVSFSKEAYSSLHTTYRIYWDIPLWKQFVGLLRSVGVFEPIIPWRLIQPYISEAECHVADSLLERTDGRFIVGVSPGGFSTPEKHWGIENFAAVLNELAKELSILPVLFGHYREVSLTWQLEERVAVPTLNLSNRCPNLGVLFALLDRVAFHITNDNGVMHLADVMDTPQVALFGPTDHRFFGPMGCSSLLVISPTGKMAGIEFDDVLRACRRCLRQSVSQRRSRRRFKLQR